MTTNSRKWTISIAAVLVLAAGAAAVMYTRHEARPTESVTRFDMVPERAQPSDDAIATAIRDAKLPVNGLSVRSAGDIVILRGSGDATAAAEAANIARGLGATRVANLIRPVLASDDEAIRREAERQLTMTRALDGSKLRVSCRDGVLRVDGTVAHELQIDVARSIARGVRGARDVQVQLTKG